MARTPLAGVVKGRPQGTAAPRASDSNPADNFNWPAWREAGGKTKKKLRAQAGPGT